MRLNGRLDVEELDPQFAALLVRRALIDDIVADLQVLTPAEWLLLVHDYLPVLRGKKRDLGGERHGVFIEILLLLLELLREFRMFLCKFLRLFEHLVDWILISCRITVSRDFNLREVIHFIIDHDGKSVSISIHGHLFNIMVDVIVIRLFHVDRSSSLFRVFLAGQKLSFCAILGGHLLV